MVQLVPHSCGVWTMMDGSDYNDQTNYKTSLDLLKFLPTFQVHPMRIID